MAAIAAQVKRAFVEWCVQKAQDANKSLRDFIASFVVSSVDSISSGLTETATSGNGYSVSYAAPLPDKLSGFSPVEITALAEELLEKFDSAADWLTQVYYYGLNPVTVRLEGWPSALPAPVREMGEANSMALNDVLNLSQKMKWDMPTVTEHRNDYGLARIARGGSWYQ